MPEVKPLSFDWVDPNNPNFRDDLMAYLMTGSEHWKPLIKPEALDIAFDALKGLKRDLEAELATLNAEKSEMQSKCWAMGHFGKQKWFDYEVEYKATRALLVRRKARVENVHAFMKPLVAAQHTAKSKRESEAYEGGEAEKLSQILLQLVTAVTEHQHSIEASSATPTISDRALWSILARVKYPTRDGEITLREWFARRVLR